MDRRADYKASHRPVEMRLLHRETITAAAHGLHQMLQPEWLQRLAQAADVHVHRAFLDKNMVAPHLIQQLGAAVHPLDVGHKEMQEAEFGRAQLDVFTVGADPVGGGRQFDTADADNLFAHLMARAGAVRRGCAPSARAAKTAW